MTKAAGKRSKFFLIPLLRKGYLDYSKALAGGEFANDGAWRVAA